MAAFRSPGKRWSGNSSARYSPTSSLVRNGTTIGQQRPGSAIARDDQKRQRSEVRANMRQKIDRRDTCPVHIVEEQDEWTNAGDILKKRAQLAFHPLGRQNGRISS